MFPKNKPSSRLGTPMTMETPTWHIKKAESSTIAKSKYRDSTQQPPCHPRPANILATSQQWGL